MARIICRKILCFSRLAGGGISLYGLFFLKLHYSTAFRLLFKKTLSNTQPFILKYRSKSSEYAPMRVTISADPSLLMNIISNAIKWFHVIGCLFVSINPIVWREIPILSASSCCEIHNFARSTLSSSVSIPINCSLLDSSNSYLKPHSLPSPYTLLL